MNLIIIRDKDGFDAIEGVYEVHSFFKTQCQTGGAESVALHAGIA